MRQTMRFFLANLAVAALCLSGCSGGNESTPDASEAPAPMTPEGSAQRAEAEGVSVQGPLSGTLRMAVTTSTYDTGLLDDLLKPEFEK